MKKEGSIFCHIGKGTHSAIDAANGESGSIFDRLPLFQPWAWKLFAAIGIVSFIASFAFASWVKYTLHTIAK